MAKCEMDSDILQEYIDGTINPLEKIVLEEHLRYCKDCRCELNKLKILEWDMYHHFHKSLDIPDELEQVRYQVFEQLLNCEENAPESTYEKDKTITREILSFQKSMFNNSLKFISFIPLLVKQKDGKKLVEKKKKKSLLRKIIGL